MKVIYTGRYVEKSVMLNGVPFQDGVPSEVGQDWFEACKNPNVKEFKKPKKANKNDNS